MSKTEPTPAGTNRNTAPLLAIDATYRDPSTDALYIHQDLMQVRAAWETEAHIAPFSGKESFGDVESFVGFVERFGGDPAPFLTWSERGLRAVLDYGTFDNPGRRGVIAQHDFARSLQWLHWERLATGQAIGQQRLIEALEDYAEDIVAPDAAALLAVLRTLRATASATADTELLADGSTKVVWQKQTGVRSAEIELPSEFQIAVPVLKGHVAPTSDGKLAPVLYSLPVRLRVSVDEQAHLAFRLSMPTAERTLEAVFEDRVAAAQVLLGADHRLYRGASER